MKIFFKTLGILCLLLVFAAYFAFLFVLPKKVDLNAYKADLQKIVKEQAFLNVDFEDVHIVTTPLLEAGIKLSGLKITLPDNSEFLATDNVRVKISLPNLLLLTVRVSEIAIDNPRINVEIAKDGSQYKIMQVVEDIINEQKKKQETTPPTQSAFNPNWIKIKVPHVNVANYFVFINDLQSRHYLALRGDNLFAALNNMKTFKVKTFAEFLSDENVNITANIDLDSFIPPAAETDEEDDPDYRADMGFVNPVLMYRDYDLKTNVAAKIKARQNHNGKIALHGYTNVEDLTMNLSGYQLPESFFRAKFRGNSTILDTNIYVAKDQNILLSGLVDYSKHPKIDLSINTKKIFFNDLITLTKAFMDTLHIKNDLDELKASGYIAANAKIKTNLKKIKSNGGIVVRDGNISNKSIGLLFKDINANVLFDDKSLKILNTYLYVNDSILKAEGSIDEKSVANISLYAEKLPLPALFSAFAPVDLKKAYSINSGNLFLDVKLLGELKKAASNIKVILSDLDVATKDKSLQITDKKLETVLASDFKTISGKIENNGLNVYLPQTASVVSNPDLTVIIDPEDLTINPFIVKMNKASIINMSGLISQYMHKPLIEFNADGNLLSEDLKQFLGKDAAQFIDAKGSLPIKLSVNGNSRRQDLICQIKSDKLNYITPLHIQSLFGKQCILQSKISFKGNRLKIKETGLFSKTTPTPFTDDYDSNMQYTEGVATVSGTITKLDTPAPFINRINIDIPKDLSMNIHAFKNSHLNFGGKLLVFGQAISPKYLGEFNLWDMSIPELFMTMKNLKMNFAAKTLHVALEDLLLNGSDIQAAMNASLEPSPIFTINNLDVKSNNIDVPRMMKVSEAAMKYAPAPSAANTQPADIPVVVRDGSIDFKRISSPPILLNNTTGRIALRNNIFYLNNLYTSTLGGNVTGEVSANLLSMLLKARVQGQNIDVERAFLELMEMKDTLSGTASFSTDLEINGAATTLEDQMKGVNGTVDFAITDGQLGPFGKLENLILAENIRESEFFQTALGGVINSLTSIQTSHFDLLNGHIVMDNGTAKLAPITSVGPVMCMNITGDMNLLTNEADMRLRARLGSKIADMLGPIAAVNPINLVKATPGLNVAAAKMFAFFCEEVTEEEMNEIPDFVEDFGAMSTTNFQVILRGDTQKPLSLIKSFKWLATVSEMNAAESFVETLPPADAENPNATLEELLAAQEEAERIKNENIFQKGIRKIKNIFSKNKK